MNEFYLTVLILPFIVAALASFIATPFSISLMKKLKIMDDPKKHKHPAIIHKKPVPRGGGVPLFIGVLAASLAFLHLNTTVILLLTASFFALAVGVLDDKYDISPYIRFVLNILTAGIVILGGTSIRFITNPLGGILYLDRIGLDFNISGMNFEFLLSDMIAIVWIVWVMNMLNWSKGVDGQMPGIVAISAFIIGVLSLRFGVSDNLSLLSSQLSFIIAGSAVGFLFFNFHPAKIFPGYGATSIYLLLASVSILSSAKLATAILVMGVPMVDGIFTIVRRLLQRRSPFLHDNKHLHHLLLRLGMGQRKIALFYWGISAILGGLSLVLTSRGKLFAIIMVVILVGGALTFLHIMFRNNEKFA